MNVVDLAPFLTSVANQAADAANAADAADAATDSPRTLPDPMTSRVLVNSAWGTWRWVTVAPGETWEVPEGKQLCAAMVMEGIATWAVGEVRESLTPAQLMTAEPGDDVQIINDSKRWTAAVVVTLPRS